MKPIRILLFIPDRLSQIKLIRIVSLLLICNSRILLIRVSTQGRYYTLPDPLSVYRAVFSHLSHDLCLDSSSIETALLRFFLTLFQSQEQYVWYILSATTESRVSISEQEDSKSKCAKLQSMELFKTHRVLNTDKSTQFGLNWDCDCRTSSASNCLRIFKSFWLNHAKRDENLRIVINFRQTCI